MRFYWDLTATILIALMALTLPFRLAFVPSWSLEWEVVDLLTDVFFLVDIALNFVTAYVNDTGQHVTSFKLISIRYLRTWFVLDVIASVPVNWVIHGGIRFTPPPVGEAAANADTSQLFSYLRLVKLFKLLRLLRVAKLLRLLKQLEQRAVVALSLPSHTVIQVCKLLLTTFTFAHWNGCIQFYLATEFDSFVDVNGTLRAHPSSWPARAELGHRSSFEQWSWSYYHAVIQLLAIGEGVVPPRRLGEIWMFTISILLGAAMYATFVASLTSAIGELGIGSRKYRARLDTLGEYMRHARFPSDLREKLLQFYELNYPGQRYLDQQEIKAEISHPLRFRVMLQECYTVLDCLQVLGDEALSRAVAGSLERQVFVHEDVIIHKGEEARGMYFVHRGTVEVLAPVRATQSAGSVAQGAATRKSSESFKQPAPSQLYRVSTAASLGTSLGDAEPKVVAVLGERAFFGEMALLTRGGLALASVRAKDFAETYHLSTAVYAKLLVLYPNFRKYLKHIAALRVPSIQENKGGGTRDGQEPALKPRLSILQFFSHGNGHNSLNRTRRTSTSGFSTTSQPQADAQTGGKRGSTSKLQGSDRYQLSRGPQPAKV